MTLLENSQIKGSTVKESVKPLERDDDTDVSFFATKCLSNI